MAWNERTNDEIDDNDGTCMALGHLIAWQNPGIN
jgi:hypothetical protein